MDPYDNPYISYGNAPDDWVNDRNKKYAEIKSFEKWKYDAETKTFKGDIEWEISVMNGVFTFSYELFLQPNPNEIKGTLRLKGGSD